MADTSGQEIATVEAREIQTLPTTPMELLSRALERGADLAMIEKLMDLADRHEQNEARRAFNKALAAAKADIPNIKKNRRVGFESKRNDGARTDYAHEDLGEIARVVAPILSKHGLSYRFRTHYEPGHPVSVTCIISHKLGYSEENSLPAPPDNSGNKNSIQAIGSTVTYLQRYTLKAALGLAAENDDDGKAAGGDGQISEDQLKELIALKDKSGADLEKFCAYFKVEALPDLRQSQFVNAKAVLQAKVAQAKKAKVGAAQ